MKYTFNDLFVGLEFYKHGQLEFSIYEIIKETQSFKIKVAVPVSIAGLKLSSFYDLASMQKFGYTVDHKQIREHKESIKFKQDLEKLLE